MSATIPKWVWNTSVSNITREEIYSQFKGFKEKDGYEGVMIVLWNNDHYMDEIYFEKYSYALEAAKELDMKIIIWDENGFPSGYAGGILQKEYPQFCAKRIDKEEFLLVKGVEFVYYPDETCQGAVLVDCDTKEILELDKRHINYTAQKDNMKIMLFNCVIANDMNGFGNKRKLVDYLSSEAVEKFISLTHEKYFEKFPQYFGNTITMAFYDEPSFWHVDGGRVWTDKFAQKFTEKYGFSPVTLYPALWEDIGEKTAYARRILFDFRSELYSNEYIKTMADWCENHGIRLTGHQDQEEILNPTFICGDLIKALKHQHIAGVDEIMYYGRGSKAYKLVSSVADNYDKNLVMCEVFGAMGEEMDERILMREGLDMFAKGINFFVAHGTWYDNNEKNIIFPPELSFRSKKFAKALSEFNSFVKDVGNVLQQGKHICEVALLYPIEDLSAISRFGSENPYTGGNVPEYSNYLNIGEKLIYEKYIDFTFIHPEVLLEKDLSCYRAILIPNMEYISIKTLERLSEYKNNGGNIIFSDKIPSKVIEVGDRESKRFEETLLYLNDGKTIDDINFSVKLKCDDVAENGNLSYIGKTIDGQNIYFIANSSDNTLNIDFTINERTIKLCLQPLSYEFVR